MSEVWVVVFDQGRKRQWVIVLHPAENGGSVSVILQGNGGRTWSGTGSDAFEALLDLRRQAELDGVIVCCAGARLDAWASGMQRAMGGGRTVYLLGGTRRGDGRKPEEAGLLDPTVLGLVARVADQEAWQERWRKSPGPSGSWLAEPQTFVRTPGRVGGLVSWAALGVFGVVWARAALEEGLLPIAVLGAALVAVAVWAMARTFRSGIVASREGVVFRNYFRSPSASWTEIARFDLPPRYGALRKTGLRAVLFDGRVLSAATFTYGPLDKPHGAQRVTQRLNELLDQSWGELRSAD